MNIADLKVFTDVFGLFSGNFDGVDKSVLADYPGLVEYHDRVANEPRIKAHYADVPEGSLRWTYQPGAFAALRNNRTHTVSCEVIRRGCPSSGRLQRRVESSAQCGGRWT